MGVLHYTVVYGVEENVAGLLSAAAGRPRDYDGSRTLVCEHLNNVRRERLWENENK